MPNDTWKPLKKFTLTFWPRTHKHMQHSYTHPWIWGHFLPHMFVMQFSHSHNYVKSKPTDVNAKMLRSPTAKHLYIWEVLMCDINILPSKATMYTRMSKAISIICTETHAHRHIYRIFSCVFLHECNHCAGRSRRRGDSPSQIYCCFKWENTLCRNSERTFFLASSLKVVIHAVMRVFYVASWWGGQYIYFQHESYASSMNGLLLPSSPPESAELSCTGKNKQSSKFGTTGTISLMTYCFPPELGWG